MASDLIGSSRHLSISEKARVFAIQRLGSVGSNTRIRRGDTLRVVRPGGRRGWRADATSGPVGLGSLATFLKRGGDAGFALLQPVRIPGKEATS